MLRIFRYNTYRQYVHYLILNVKPQVSTIKSTQQLFRCTMNNKLKYLQFRKLYYIICLKKKMLSNYL